MVNNLRSITIIGPNGITPLSSEQDIETLEQLARGVIERMMGMNQQDLGSAHFLEFDANEYVPPSYFEDTIDLLREIKEKGKFETDKYPHFLNMPKVFENIIYGETSLKRKGNHIHALHFSTRDTLDKVFNEVATKKGKSIAIPLPSWHFWNLSGKEKEEHKLTFFDAINENQLVSNFSKVAKDKDVGAVVLVDPANPLLYRISESAGKEINKIALKNGIEIIVDDVLRGTFPIGSRDSVARFFDRPYVVEGLSKRFGDNPFGELSYCLAPKKLDFPKDEQLNGDSMSLLFGSNVDMALKHSSSYALDELESRNKAFDEGMRYKSVKGVNITRPSPSSLISLIELPKSDVNAYEFAKRLYYNTGIRICPVSVFYPDGHDAPKEVSQLFRVSIGKHYPDELLRIGQTIGGGIKHVYSERKI